MELSPVNKLYHVYEITCSIVIHLFLRRLNLDGVSKVPNNVAGDANLQGKYMRFLNKECNEGENHTTQTDCRAKVQIHFSEGRSVQVSRHVIPEYFLFKHGPFLLHKCHGERIYYPPSSSWYLISVIRHCR
jgi:hypothetical protein